jgi:hypothetical protein
MSNDLKGRLAGDDLDNHIRLDADAINETEPFEWTDLAPIFD